VAVKRKLLLQFLETNGLTIADLAKAIGVNVYEIEKLLRGKTVGVYVARKFIRYFGAEKASGLIDWKAIGKENPLACEQ
jgi:plasmid maintenance system antidote protein VapI